MCMSFADIPMKRQEEVWAQTNVFAYEDNDRFWQGRAAFYRDYMFTVVYRVMSTQDIEAHIEELKQEHGESSQWALIISVLEQTLKERADVGAL